ncbi:acyltransferase family protein [Azospirillum doebereinerae]|uniref:acyltransferase family protein n=1 Tax=Azospirillum doebereinerae TaxID=92933 RepID=UPI001EE60823|nr:acyltransferase [Azospirillum doebereinerae]MCG5239652.1 acyltransferase [Azospirillum doebereinerae]
MRFQVLDGWRGVCALLVALLHFPAFGHLFHLPLLRNAYLFVDFFFVLSGFVITHAYGRRLTDLAALTGYAIRRFGRLWPLHAVTLGVFVLIELCKLLAGQGLGITFGTPPFTGITAAEAIPTNLALIHALGVHDNNTWNGPSWSISTEFYVCLLFGLLVLTARRHLAILAAVIALGGWLAVAILSPRYMGATYDYGFFRCLCGFFLGHLVHRVHLAVTEWPGFRQTAFRVLPLLEVAGVGLLIAGLSVPDLEAGGLASPPAFAAIVLIFSFEAGPLSRLLSSAPARWLGTRSYSIYMVHMIVVFVLWLGTSMAQKSLGRPLFGQTMAGKTEMIVLFHRDVWLADAVTALYVLCVLALAAITHRWIEEPGRRLFNDLANRRRPARLAEAG